MTPQEIRQRIDEAFAKRDLDALAAAEEIERATCTWTPMLQARDAMALVPGADAALRAIDLLVAGGVLERASAPTEQCAAYRYDHRDANVCKDDLYSRPAVPSLNASKKELEHARRALDAGDTRAAARHMRVALDTASTVDRLGTFIAELVAVKIVNDALDVVDSRPAAFSPELRLELASHIRLESPAHPFETMRLHDAWVAARDRRAKWGPIGEAFVTDAMLEADEVAAEMDRATVARDVERCKRAAADGTHRLFGGGDLASLCERAVTITRAGDRVRAFRRQAIKDSDPPTPSRSF